MDVSLTTHPYTRIVLNRGLTACEETAGGLGVRNNIDSSLLEAIDSKQMVKNLCASQVHHPMDFFLTFTCNQRKHFGTRQIKIWIDSMEWKDHFPKFGELNKYEVREIEKAMVQASASVLLRVWQEVCKLFLDYLRKSPSSPYKKTLSIFARHEYQKDAGNLSHIHLLLQVDWKCLKTEEKEFVRDLIRASVLDVVRHDDAIKLVEDGVLEHVDDRKGVIEDAKTFLGHVCNERCKACVAPGVFRCRKLNNLEVSEDNTKNTYKLLPNDYSDECRECLAKIGLAEQQTLLPDGTLSSLMSHLPFFHPKRHIPPTNPTGDINMSPVEWYTFSVCRSMQNCQILTECGGVNKYVCKYIAKIDEQNYVVVSCDHSKNGALISETAFLHNTKITSSKMNEDKQRETKRDHNHVQGRIISLMEMLHSMLRYPEVYTDLCFISITTTPLELRPGIEIQNGSTKFVTDEADTGIISNQVRQELGLEEFRQHSETELVLLEDLKQSKVSIDRISEFGIRPPELRLTFNSVGNYFRWFKVTKRKMKRDEMMERINISLHESLWVDGMQRCVRVRERALEEIKDYLENDEEIQSETSNAVQQVKALLMSIINVVETCNDGVEGGSDDGFYQFVRDNLISNEA